MSRQSWFTSVSSLWASACAVAIAGPIALWIPGLEPPWPEGSAAIVAVVFSVIALVIGHVCFLPIGRSAVEHERLTRRSLWIGCASLLVSVLLCVVYLYGYSMYVVAESKLEGTREVRIRRVVGTELIDAKNAKRPDIDLLKEYSFEEDRLWTRQSLTGPRLFVLLPYAGMFFFLSLGLSSLARRIVREADDKRFKSLPTLEPEHEL